MNVGLTLLRSARRAPTAVAVRYGERTLSYEEFAERCRRLAAGLLDLGLAPGERLIIVQSNRPELLETLYAGLLAGLVVVPVNARLHPAEVRVIAEDAQAAGVVLSEEFGDELARHTEGLPLVRICTNPRNGEWSMEGLIRSTAPLAGPVAVDSDDLAWLFYTSGTTGRPKGVMWSHRTLLIGLMSFLADIYSYRPDDVVLHAAPLTHGSGSVALASFARGAENVILNTPTFDPGAFAETIERRRVTSVAFLVPTQIVKLLREVDPARHDLSSLRSICYGGGPIYLDDIREALARFGPVWVQVYGQGESPMTISYLSREDHARWLVEDPRRLGSAGIPRTDIEVRVVDEDDRPLPASEVGEIVVRGDIVMQGYWRQPEATAEALRDGWLHTGDVGAFDDRGYLSIVDRRRDMVVSGGMNVYSREVENALLEHPAVRDVAVVGVPDDYWGEAVHAVVVLRPGASLTEEDLIRHAGGRLAGYKRPKSVEFVADLPANAAGKVLKRDLRDRYWTGHDRRVGGGSKPVPSG